MNCTKKIISLLLALVLCIGTLAACNAEPAETTKATEPAGTTAPASTTEAPTEPAPLTNAERHPIDFDGTLKVATGKEVSEEKVNWLRWEEWTGVDVEWNTVAQEQTALLFLDDASMPDILFQTSGLTVTQINEYGQGGLLVNIMEHLDKMPNLSARYAENPGLFDAVKDGEGNVYTLPYYCNTLTMASNCFFVRTDMTKEAGIEELPTTIEGFLEMCETLQTYYANDGSGNQVKGLGTLELMRPHGVEIFYTDLLTLNQEEQDTYNDCWVAIENKAFEMDAAFITGQKNLDTDWDSYVDELYNLGLQDVIDVYQAALDRYNAG